MGTWDDHDIGMNDGDSTFDIKSESQIEFLDFIGEPADSARRAQGGVYGLHELDYGPGRHMHPPV